MKIHEYQAKEILARYGVAVPRGAHTVTMRYRPLSVYLGAALTLLGILGALGLAVGSRRKQISGHR